MKKILLSILIVLVLTTPITKAQTSQTQDQLNSLIMQLIDLLQKQVSILQSQLVAMQSLQTNPAPQNIGTVAAPSSSLQEQTQQNAAVEISTEVSCDSIWDKGWQPLFTQGNIMKFNNYANVDVTYWDSTNPSVKYKLNTQLDGIKPGSNNPNGPITLELNNHKDGFVQYNLVPYVGSSFCKTDEYYF